MAFVSCSWLKNYEDKEVNMLTCSIIYVGLRVIRIERQTFWLVASCGWLKNYEDREANMLALALFILF